jgi:alanine dehydrogenase
MNELLKRLQSELSKQTTSELPRKFTVDLFLGNDREIGRERKSQEKRVGITPSHVKELKDFLSGIGLGLNVFVMQGAGQRAGFPDSDYIRSGAEILTEVELEHHDHPPDVFHALKEPSKYESRIPTPFCRIGAVHGGNFHSASGLADLLATGDVAVFDGSNIGAPGVYRIPIRGRMSTFAGEIAADWITDHLRDQRMRGRVVIVGGGRAGQATARKLSALDFVSEIHLFEDQVAHGRSDSVRAAVSELTKIKVLELEGRDDPRLLSSLDQGCVAALFAVARPGEKAPRVVHVSHLTGLHKKAIVVDISIDEKGAIFDPSILPTWDDSRIIEHLEKSLAERGIVYRAQSNMPRGQPKEASEAHGDTILPYIATLLYLAAREGGAKGVRSFMAEQPVDMSCGDPQAAPPGRLLEALIQDLRNGLAFYTFRDRIVVEDVVPDRVNTLSFLLGREIAFEFSLPPRETLKRDKLKEIENALELFPEDVRGFLQFAFEHGIKASVISHPKKDGTTTKDAAEALLVPKANVLKTLIWSKDGELIATISSGTKFIDKNFRLPAATGAHEIRLAEPSEVMAATGHVPGAVPIIGLFTMKDTIKAVYVSEEVLRLGLVYGSAGSVFLGFSFEPEELIKLGAVVAALTPPDSILRRSEKKVGEFIREIEAAVERDDDESAAKAVSKLQSLLQASDPLDSN